MLQAELQGQVLHWVPPGCRAPGRSHRGDGHFGSALPSCLNQVGELERGKAFSPLPSTPGLIPPSHAASQSRYLEGGWFPMETQRMPPHLRGCHCHLAGLAQRGAPLATTPTCKIQLAAAAIGAEPPPGQERWQERIWARGKTGRQVGIRGNRLPYANLLSSRSLSARTSRSSAKTQPHSFQLQPSPPAPLDRLRQLRSRARECFPALLSSAFPSCAGISSKSQQAHGSQQDPPGESVTTAQEDEGIHLYGHVPSQGTALMSQQSGRAQRTQLSTIRRAAVPALTEHQSELRRLQLGLP